ncbi:MAG: ABC transporter substrate-binding protein [Burkholderiales bacterium]|nr:ABC transporter substrate-binding protein [Burkholderiales bacterium]
MTRRSITIAAWDYDRVRAIMDGRVPVEGCDVNFLPLAPEECFHRTYLNREFEVAEIGFSPHLIALSRGTNDYVALPIFLSRMYRHSAIYIRTDRGIATAADLAGKRVGVPEYQMSAAMWARGMVQDDHGVPPAAMRWFQGGLEVPGRKDKFPLNLPAGFPLAPVPEGATLSGMLAAGELDAVFSARAPSCYRQPGVPVARLYEDYATAEREYAKRTGIFPIMHALGVRADVLAAAPWLAMSLCKAFGQAKKLADQDLFEVTALKIGLPWIGDEAMRTRELMGEDFWPYGVEPNRRTLETMARYSFEQGLATRLLKVEEMFAPASLEAIKV